MNPSKLLRYLLSLLSFSIVEDEGGGVGEEVSTATEEPAQVETQEASKHASMLDAINAHLSQSEQTGQPRDELGRFAQKQAEQQAAQATPAPQVQQPASEKPEDDLAMPEGLQPKAQERFQRLANSNKELMEQVAQRDQALGYVQQTFQENGIQREQFEAAASFLGAVNRGDFATAEQLILGQLKQLSLLTGKNYTGGAVDALGDFPDLREAVDGLQITEQHAMEIARGRAQQVALQHRAQQEHQQRQQHQAQQTREQEVNTARDSVDRLCKQLAASDLDYPAIEAQLLPMLPQLLQGVPPNHWENSVRAHYDLLKKSAAAFRSSAAPQTSRVLRPTGAAAGAAAPNSMYDAMWNRGG